ncbi:MAG TPA: helix-turn-helix transcriptional regulator [Blastocatellia bacterium]|nr:helix-turn-helix transcriptional regulator [Blastocatellia bacterium]
MGKVARPKPKFLAKKLKEIRVGFGLSQSEMLKQLELDERVFYSAISGYELGTREPSLPVLLKYARLAGICLDVLVDDELDLPAKVPAKKIKHLIKE